MIRLPWNIFILFILVSFGVLVSIVITRPVQYAFERLFTRSMK